MAAKTTDTTPSSKPMPVPTKKGKPAKKTSKKTTSKKTTRTTRY